MRVGLFFLVGLWLCSPSALAADEPEPPVLETGEIRITSKDLAQALAGLSAEELRAVQADPTKAEALARDLLQLHEVERQARIARLEEDPMVAWRIRQARQAVLQRALLARFVEREGFPDSEQLAQERYAARPGAYRTPHRIRIAQIFIQAQDGDKVAARQKAEQLLARVRAGEDFADLAKTSSDGPHAERGGEFPDWLTRGVVRDNPLVAAAFALTDTGEVTEVLESQWGFHILRLLDVQEARQRTFEEVKGAILEELMHDYEKQIQQNFQATLEPTEAVRIDAPLFQRLVMEAVEAIPATPEPE